MYSPKRAKLYRNALTAVGAVWLLSCATVTVVPIQHRTAYEPAMVVADSMSRICARDVAVLATEESSHAECFQRCLDIQRGIPGETDINTKLSPLLSFLNSHEPSIWTTRVLLLAACKIRKRHYDWTTATLTKIRDTVPGTWESVIASWQLNHIEWSHYESERGHTDAKDYERFWTETDKWFQAHAKEFAQLDSTLANDASFARFAACMFSPVRSFEIHLLVNRANCAEMRGNLQDAAELFRTLRRRYTASPHFAYYDDFLRRQFDSLWTQTVE